MVLFKTAVDSFLFGNSSLFSSDARNGLSFFRRMKVASGRSKASKLLADPAGWPAWWLTAGGVLALILCLVATHLPNIATHWPKTAALLPNEMTPISAKECQKKTTDLKSIWLDDAKQADRIGKLRIVGFGPDQIELGSGLCLVVAGVTPAIQAEQEAAEAEGALSDRDEANKALDEAIASGGDSEITEARTRRGEAARALKDAYVALATPDAPTELTLYFNELKAPFTVMASSVAEPQPIYVALEVPFDGTNQGEFWRGLVRNVGWTTMWGTQSVVIGVARTGSETTSPEATTIGMCPGQFPGTLSGGERCEVTEGEIKIVVYSPLAFGFGLAGLALLTAAMIALAARTPLLRDNTLRVRDIYPQALQEARTERKTSHRLYNRASPSDPQRANKRKAFLKARERVGNYENALQRISPELLKIFSKDEKESTDETRRELDEVAKQFGGRVVGSYSLGRSQMAFWLILVTAGYVYIALSIGQFFNIMNATVVTLLGISAATGFGSVLINREAYSDACTDGYIRDVVSIDGSPQLQRIQTLVWTLILGAVFIWIAIGEYRFAEFDDKLLLLMGLSGGLYLGFKFYQEPEVVAQRSTDEATNSETEKPASF